jgi:acetate kinase
MGMTPTEGLLMGTRCGDVDPGVLNFIMKQEGLKASDMCDMINKTSGVLAISGVSSDMRELIVAKRAGNQRAILAQNVYNYRIKKYIGAYAAAMGGLDILVFTGGVGENQFTMRRAVCLDMEYMGMQLDDAKNDEMYSQEMVISTPESNVTIMVVPTNEEYIIAADTKAILTK